VVTKVHLKQANNRTTCGLDYTETWYGRPRSLKTTEDPHAVTCIQCGRNRTLRELLSPWPAIGDAGINASLVGWPESSRRKVRLITRPLTRDEVEVFMDFILDKVPLFFLKPE
jgi:hypothetical protein